MKGTHTMKKKSKSKSEDALLATFIILAFIAAIVLFSVEHSMY